MNGPRPHPLDNLIKDDSLFFLEAMVPFVDYRFKKPLVLFIKYRELSAIMQCLDDKPYIADCGFDCHPKSTEDMITDMCRFLPGNYANSIKQMKQMMQMMEVMNASDMMKSFGSGNDFKEPPYNEQTDYGHEPPPDHNPSDYDNKSSGHSHITSHNNNSSLYDSVLTILNNEY